MHSLRLGAPSFVKSSSKGWVLFQMLCLIMCPSFKASIVQKDTILAKFSTHYVQNLKQLSKVLLFHTKNRSGRSLADASSPHAEWMNQHTLVKHFFFLKVMSGLGLSQQLHALISNSPRPDGCPAAFNQRAQTPSCPQASSNKFLLLCFVQAYLHFFFSMHFQVYETKVVMWTTSSMHRFAV